jgi:pilus assembly protein Flp/PilA
MIVRFLSDERASTALEYALIASLISIAIVGSVTQWSDEVVKIFNEISENFVPAS